MHLPVSKRNTAMDVTFIPVAAASAQAYTPCHDPEPVMDDIINAVGFGRWTYLYFIISAFVPMALVGNLFISEFSAPYMKFICVPDDVGEDGSTPGLGLWTDENYGDYSDYEYNSSAQSMLSQQDLLIERRNLQILQSMENQDAASLPSVASTKDNRSNATGLAGGLYDDGVDYRNGRILEEEEDYDFSNLESHDARSQCSVQLRATLTTTGVAVQSMSCTSFLFDSDLYGWTITEEFSLVCNRDWLRAVYQVMFTLGCILGAATGGVLSDKHGRQRTIFWGSALACSASLLATVALCVEMIMVCRLLLGFCTFVAVNPLTTLALEVCPLVHRHLYGPIESLPYAVMLPLLASAAYLCRHWRPLQLSMTVPLFVALLLSSPFVMDESPRWLVLRGRVAEAERAVRRAARLNYTTHQLSGALHQQLDSVYKRHLRTQCQDSVSVLGHLRSLVSSAEMRAITFVTVTMWFIEGALYISLPLQATEYQSPFLYLSLIGVLEIPGALLVAPLGEYLGRRTACSFLSFVCACAMLLLSMLRQQPWASENAQMLVSVVAYTALVGVSQMVTILTSELYPTSVRSLGSSVGYLFNNIGNCVPPLLDMLLSSQQSHVSLLVYSTLALVNCYLALHLPETNGRRLYETVDELVDEERSVKCDIKVV